MFIVFAVLLATTVASAQVTHRPIEDFLKTQVLMLPWVDQANPTVGGAVDFGGINYRWFLVRGVDLGSTYWGDITETALPDGRAKVHVVVHGTNVFVRGVWFPSGTTVFGATRPEILAGMTPALGTFLLMFDFINESVGAPIPDFYTIETLESALLTVRGEGPLRAAFGVPEGTRGFMQMTQRGLSPGNGVPGGDYWPVEHIVIQPIGD